MSDTVVVLGAGYAGTTAVKRLERELDDDTELVWVSKEDYHLVLHEVHRVVRDPAVQEDVTVPVESVAGRGTEFVQGEVVDVDTDEQGVSLADDSTIDYDYLLVALGSQTAFYGIPGLAEQARTLKGLDDALAINGEVHETAAEASHDDPAEIVVGGAGLSGIQCAGEIAELRDEENLPVNISLVEAMEEIMPGMDDDLQAAVREQVEAKGIDILTDDPIVEATDDVIEFDERDALEYDVLVWTGGITGQDALDGANLEDNHNRVETDATFRTSDERVFAVGDSALIEQGDEDIAPPTAQAAWQAGEVAGRNVARRIEGRPLETWTHVDKGTVISIGERAVAHDVMYVPLGTFDGTLAKVLKKGIAARWLKDVDGIGRAVSSWESL